MTDEQPIESKALRKKLRREEKKQQQAAAARRQQKRQQVQKYAIWVIPLLLLGLAAWGLSRSSDPTPDNQNQSAIAPEDDPVIAPRGMHWHANLAIVIKGERVTIPANIGLTGGHADMHTHTVNDQIHLEMNRAARYSDTRLGNFFDIWGETFNDQCILDSCTGEDDIVTMLVNGEPNNEFENYHLQDGDRVEIRFE